VKINLNNINEMTINIKKKKIKDEIIYKYHVFNIIDLIKVRDPHVIIIS